MRSFNGEKLAGARANQADYIHAQMATIFRHAGF